MDNIIKAPISFRPYLKTVIWGGDKICAYKGIPQPEPNIGESWEISAVPGHDSVVEGGAYDGETLTSLIDRFGPQLLGDRVAARYDGKFPLLIKIIDARDNLSVQVHPDDTLAMKRHNSLGKTEMWYIIDSDPGSKIYAGLSRQLTPELYGRMVAEGTFADALAAHDCAAGDIFFLPTGRVHAIGAGNLLAEIQESSDITYRIFDYNRRDAAGNTRELHTELAKDAIDYTVRDDYKSAPADPSVKDAGIVKCSHFDVRRILSSDGDGMELHTDPSSFTVIMCLDGEATVTAPEGSVTLRKGHTILIPATAGTVEIKGTATLLTAQA